MSLAEGVGYRFPGKVRLCPACGSIITGIACAKCVSATGYQHYLQMQKEFLPAVLRGEAGLRLVPVRGTVNQYHLELFEVRVLAWCGAPIGPYVRRIGRNYGTFRVRSQEICPACLEAFDKILAEIGGSNPGSPEAA